MDEKQLRSLVLAIWRAAGFHSNSDLLDDCLFEAYCCCWKIGPALEALPAEERPAYTKACVRHAVHRVLRREDAQRGETVSLEDLRTTDGRDIELIAAAASRLPDLPEAGLLDQVERPDLAAVLNDAKPHDYLILDGYYAHGLTDRDIGLQLGMNPEAVKARRRRILAQIRRALDGPGARRKK